MPNITDLILAITQPIVEYPDEVEVNIQDTEEFREYHLKVNPEDIGRVIGKQGRVAQAIRTIIYSVRTEDNKRVRFVIDDRAN